MDAQEWLDRHFGGSLEEARDYCIEYERTTVKERREMQADLARLRARVGELEAVIRSAVGDLDLPGTEYSILERRAIAQLRSAVGG